MIVKSQAERSFPDPLCLHPSTQQSYRATLDDEWRRNLRDENSSANQIHNVAARPSLSARANADADLAKRLARNLRERSASLHAARATYSRRNHAAQSRAALVAE